MRLSAETKGTLVFDRLASGRKTFQELQDETGLNPSRVRNGIEWIRDYELGSLVTERKGRTVYYKLAETVDEVTAHISWRTKSLHRMALRLERMTFNALQQWPDNKLLKIMHRHLVRMREDVEELV